MPLENMCMYNASTDFHINIDACVYRIYKEVKEFSICQK